MKYYIQASICALLFSIHATTDAALMPALQTIALSGTTLFSPMGPVAHCMPTEQRRTIIPLDAFVGTTPRFAGNYKHLTPLAGPALQQFVENTRRHSSDNSPLTELIRSLFHMGHDQIMYPTRHKGSVGTFLTPELYAELVAKGITGQLLDFQKRTDFCKLLIEHHQQETGVRNRDKLKERKVMPLLENFAAITDPTQTTYPPYMGPGIIALSLWLKYNDPADLEKYIQKLDKHTACLKKPTVFSRFQDMFFKQDLPQLDENERQLIQSISSASISLRDDYSFERRIATFLHMHMNITTTPAAIRNTPLSFLEQKEIVPDCAEASLRDFFGCLLNNNKMADLSLLPATIQPKQAFIEFFEQYKSLTPEIMNSKQAAQAWMNIVSGHPEIAYCQQNHNDPSASYEINSDVDNLLTSINHLLNINATSFEELGRMLSHEKLSLQAWREGNIVKLTFKNNSYQQEITAHFSVSVGKHTTFDVSGRANEHDEETTNCLVNDINEMNKLTTLDTQQKHKVSLLTHAAIAGIDALNIPETCSDTHKARQRIFASRIPSDLNFAKLYDIIDHYAKNSQFHAYIPTLIELNRKQLDKKLLGKPFTLLHKAALLPTIEPMRLLLEHGADMNNSTTTGSTPLLYATRCNAPTDNIKFLWEQGADIHATDNFGQNALFFACARGNYHTAKFLIQKGINTEIVDTNQKTALDYLRSADNKEEAQRIRDFIETSRPTGRLVE